MTLPGKACDEGWRGVEDGIHRMMDGCIHRLAQYNGGVGWVYIVFRAP